MNCPNRRFTNQVPYSLVERTCVRTGFWYLPDQRYAATHISFRTKSPAESTAPSRMARAHKTASIRSHWPGSRVSCVITIPMSANPEHQKENLAAADILLSGADFESIG
jgi:diketogulonate reductase-like aldo/keto reductase